MLYSSLKQTSKEKQRYIQIGKISTLYLHMREQKHLYTFHLLNITNSDLLSLI